MITELERAPTDAAPEGAPAIELTDIGVRFLLPTEKIVSFKEYILRRLTNRIGYQELWALESVNLSVRPGETFGVLGRNGAGKSTLLKVISRVLRPTRGRVVVRGRTAPLLELGAGFHPDLTGRENVYLNGALLGHPKKRIDRVFDEVVEFAELAEFIDVPVRSYSSGMQARLGFSVATVFRPDILILDEILAVGDTGFQQKCLARLHEFRELGTTTLLVSHTLETILAHCDRVAWIEHGAVKRVGDTEAIVAEYEASMGAPTP